MIDLVGHRTERPVRFHEFGTDFSADLLKALCRRREELSGVRWRPSSRRGPARSPAERHLEGAWRMIVTSGRGVSVSRERANDGSQPFASP